MKLLTKKIRQALPKLHGTRGKRDALVIAKFFAPWTKWTWYLIEGSYDEELRDWEFYGLVQGHANEFGYFLLSELEAAKGPFGLKIERDRYWIPKPISEVYDVVKSGRIAC